MEGFLSAFPSQRCPPGPLSIVTQRTLNCIPVANSLKMGSFRRNLELGFLGRNCRNKGRDVSVGVQRLGVDSDERESETDWELEFLGELDPLGFQPPKKRKQQKSEALRDTESMDWCNRARRVALKSIEARGLTQRMEAMFNKKKKKKKKNKKDKKLVDKDMSVKGVKRVFGEDLEFDIEEDYGSEDLSPLGDTSHLREAVSALAGGMFEERKSKTKQTFAQRLSQFSGPSDRRKEINLNKALVEAQTAAEVLEVAYEMIMAVGKGLSPSPLSPLNVATALHRIAKNMERVSMMRTHRLAFARKREMSILVGIAMTALPECSAQGLSNISWALSKIGGELLYMSEMDRIAEVALTKIGEFNSQNVANLAGAFASMQHSAPDLFAELSKRASTIIYTFQEQELAQVLWAFASLFETADSMLEALDSTFKDASQFKVCSIIETSNQDQERSEHTYEDLPLEGASGLHALNFNRDQLGNIAWSYAVLGEMNRVFFNHVWNILSNCEEDKILDHYREDIMFASQICLVNQSLKVECPHLQLNLSSGLEEKITSAGKTKRFNQKKTSSFQKEVARLLVSTGLQWVKEYDMDGYSLDAVLIDKKVALEIDGPTHFSRNSGTPLGHTMLKRRYITAAGWKLLSVSHQEWEELEGEFKQLEYLRELLKDFIGQPSSMLYDEQESSEFQVFS